MVSGKDYQMMMFQAWTRAALFVAALLQFQTFGQQTTNSTLTGQWDFNDRSLKATVGTDLQYLGDTATNTTFKTVEVNGANGNVMQFPAADATQGYLMFHGAKPNGGGTNVNVYTLVLDLLWPAESSGAFRALFNSDTNNATDAIMFVNPDDAIRVNNDYAGQMLPDTWYRLALSFDLTTNTVTKYLNGTLVGTQTLDVGVDSQYSLGPALLLFTTKEAETRLGLVDRIQFYSQALTEDQVKALGSPVGDGGPPIAEDVKIETIQKTGTDVIITVSGGGTLQLQHQTKLTDTTWQDIGQPNSTGTFTVPATDATGFFRAKRL